MTDSKHDSGQLALTELVQAALRRAARLTPSTILTHCVVVVQTFTEDETGKHYDIHRIYPFGALDPSTERGILADAIEDSREERRDAS